MLGSLITLPFRIGRRSAGLAWHASQAVVERAVELVGGVIMPTTPESGQRDDGQRARQGEGGHGGRQDGGRDEDPSRAQQPDQTQGDSDEGRPGSDRPQTRVDPRSAADPAAAESVPVQARAESPAPSPEAPSPVPTPPEPEHVSEEATLVEEVSEPGAEDGAGAQIHVAEPWEGYRELKAADIVDRIQGASAAALAAVELYELSHRRRQTVLESVERELRRAANAP